MMDYKYLKKTFNQLEPGDTIYYLRNSQLVKINVETVIEFVTGKIKICGRDIHTGDNFSLIIKAEDKDNAIFNYVIFSNVYELIKDREEEIKVLKDLILSNIHQGKYSTFNLLISEVKALKKTIEHALS